MLNPVLAEYYGYVSLKSLIERDVPNYPFAMNTIIYDTPCIGPFETMTEAMKAARELFEHMMQVEARYGILRRLQHARDFQKVQEAYKTDEGYSI